MIDIAQLQRILVSCMELQPKETLLVVTDEEKEPIASCFYKAGLALGATAILCKIPVANHSGIEPPAPVGVAMQAARVVLLITTHSLSHTLARQAGARAGARIASMPGITEALLSAGAITANYNDVEALTLRLTALLNTAQNARLCVGEKEMYFSLAGRKGVPSTGKYTQPGQAGNLPSGEAYIAPVEAATKGDILIDGSFVGLGLLQQALHLHVEQGQLQTIKGPGAEKLGILFESPANGVLCELGIGTNAEARLCGIILEDEKIYGTVHVAFGTNVSFGGKNHATCHLDGVILRPTLYLDEKKILEDGNFFL